MFSALAIGSSRAAGSAVVGQQLHHAVRRSLNLHEYQAKELMDAHGICTQLGTVAATPVEARREAAVLKSKGVESIALKAQIFAGGRGKGTFLENGFKGGVQFSKSPEEIQAFATQMLGNRLVTHQTGADGLPVRKLMLVECVEIDKEFYLALVLDRKLGGLTVIASRMGGIDIEEVAEKDPSAILVVPVDIQKGLTPCTLDKIAKFLLPTEALSVPAAIEAKRAEVFEALRKQLKELLPQLHKMFDASDAAQIEVNPLAITKDARVLCIDAKVTIDDNAFYRQKKLFAEEDKESRDPRELAAEEHHLNFVTMDGEIGCLVNGAGLAMATMDLISLHGAKAANFLDLGGGATEPQVTKALELLSADPNVKAIFINIFGGITRCDVVAQGILNSARKTNIKVPLVVRLVGNSAEKASIMLNELRGIRAVQDLNEAAKVACSFARDRHL